MVTKEDIISHSQIYHHYHKVTDSDVEKANELIAVIEETRCDVPKCGDIVIARGPKKTYNNGHIQLDDLSDYSAMCVQPYLPFVSWRRTKDNEKQILCSTSGGYWFSLPTDSAKNAIKFMEYEGQRVKSFKAWGHCGPCGDGAFTFEAPVNVWKVYLKTIY